jgi:hypothetical protein
MRLLDAPAGYECSDMNWNHSGLLALIVENLPCLSQQQFWKSCRMTRRAFAGR